jgi:phage gp37-like protein
MGILAVEDALVTRIKAVLGNKVKGVESLPGDWDDDMLRRLLRLVPGVFVAFAGGGAKNAGSNAADIESQWIVYVVTGHASGEAARRRGDALQAGAYELAELLVPALHLFAIAGVGTMVFSRLENLYTGMVDRQGLSVYAITFQLPMCFSADLDLSALDDFETFDAQYDVPPLTTDEHQKWLDGDYATSNPDAHDAVTLPIE